MVIDKHTPRLRLTRLTHKGICMISVEVKKNGNGKYVGFSVKGHAGYDIHGKDIVCSAISMLVINTVNSLEKLTDAKFRCDTDKSGKIILEFQDEVSPEAELLVDSMILGVESVVEQYGKSYVRLMIKEV